MSSKYKILLFGAIALFSIYFTYVAFLRHDNMHSLRLDLGNMDQTVWNVLHGNGFTLTDPLGSAQISRLAVHGDFMLIFLAPFYLLWSNPKMLIIIQTIMLAIGAVPIFWLAKKVLKDERLGLLFSFAYLLYPTIQMNTAHDFHATSLTTTFLLFAFWYFTEERPVWFLLFSVLAAFGKESFWIVTALLGAAWMLKKRYRAFGAIVTVANLVIFYLLFWVFIPMVTPAKQHWALSYLADYGGGMNEILKNIFLNPIKTITTIVAPDRLSYYFQLFAPLGFLSFAAPQFLVFAIPDLAINVLSSQPLMRMIDYQYTSGITPWIFVSAIYGYSWLQKKSPFIWVVLGVCVVFSVHYWGDLPYGVRSRYWFFRWAPPEKETIQQVAKMIPQEASVSATNNIGAHFSQREFLYTYPMNATTSSYIAVYLGDRFAWPSGEEQSRVLQLLLADPSYELIAHTGSFSAFKKISL